MSKFWQKKYTSKYTGKQIDDAIGQVIEGGGTSNIVFLTADVNGDLGLSYNDIITGISAGSVYIYKYTEEEAGPPSFNTLCFCFFSSTEAAIGTPAGDLYTVRFFDSYANNSINFYSTTASGILNINEPTP